MIALPRRLYFGAVIAVIVMPALAPVVAAQTTGSVVGIVKDSQGAVIPGATVSLVSETRGTAMETQSTAAGDFEFTSVIADRYTIRITLQGFKTTERKSLDVSPGDRVVVGSITIAVGDLEAWAKRAKLKVLPGDVVLIRTGRWARRDAKGPWPSSQLAGLYITCARWLQRARCRDPRQRRCVRRPSLGRRLNQRTDSRTRAGGDGHADFR